MGTLLLLLLLFFFLVPSTALTVSEPSPRVPQQSTLPVCSPATDTHAHSSAGYTSNSSPLTRFCLLLLFFPSFYFCPPPSLCLHITVSPLRSLPLCRRLYHHISSSAFSLFISSWFFRSFFFVISLPSATSQAAVGQEVVGDRKADRQRCEKKKK